MKWYIIMVFICISLMTNDSIFSCAYLLSEYFLWWSVYSNLLPIFKKKLGFFITEFWDLIVYAEYKSFVSYVICKYFLLVLAFLFSFQNLLRTDVLVLLKSKLSVFLKKKSIMFLMVYLRSFCLTQGHKDFSLMFPSRNFISLGFTLRSVMTHF